MGIGLFMTSRMRDFLLHADVSEPTRATLAPFLDHPCLDDDHVPFSLTRGSRVYFAPPKPKPKSPELQRILDVIRAEQEESEYERMTGRHLSDSDLASPDAAQLGEDPKAVSKVLIGSFNVFFTAASVFVAVMWIGPTISDNVAWRVMAAFSLAMIILAGEGWLAYRSAFQRKME
ncbi:hypothetical protein H9P43_008613 [Blastocladiella emersonii ATCC 22665]|nr:hypothetical protein H9P43_008613 [Blastocladiella emersonii ATCC 22665]